jgi:hypothetical protein
MEKVYHAGTRSVKPCSKAARKREKRERNSSLSIFEKIRSDGSFFDSWLDGYLITVSQNNTSTFFILLRSGEQRK